MPPGHILVPCYNELIGADARRWCNVTLTCYRRLRFKSGSCRYLAGYPATLLIKWGAPGKELAPCIRAWAS